MGIRGYAQVKQPEYGDCCLTSWAQGAAYRWLVDVAGLDICTGDCDGGSADKWEIEIPSRERIEHIVSHLRRRPKCLGEDGEDGNWPSALANLLEEGLEAAVKNGYDWIVIDWF